MPPEHRGCLRLAVELVRNALPHRQPATQRNYPSDRLRDLVPPLRVVVGFGKSREKGHDASLGEASDNGSTGREIERRLKDDVLKGGGGSDETFGVFVRGIGEGFERGEVEPGGERRKAEGGLSLGAEEGEGKGRPHQAGIR